MRRIFLIGDRSLRPGRPLVDSLAEAAAAGVDSVMIREKDLSGAQLHEIACAAVESCRPHGCRVYVNGRFDVALAAGADGVHLPSSGLPVAQVRRAVGVGLEIGASTHSVEQALAAERDGADYVFLGPVFQTRDKPDPLGVEEIGRAAGLLKIPLYPIGGIDRESVGALLELPIAGVAVIRAILAEPDIPAAVGGLRARLSQGRPDAGALEDAAEVEDDDPGEPEGGDPEGGAGWGQG